MGVWLRIMQIPPAGASLVTASDATLLLYGSGAMQRCKGLTTITPGKNFGNMVIVFLLEEVFARQAWRAQHSTSGSPAQRIPSRIACLSVRCSAPQPCDVRYHTPWIECHIARLLRSRESAGAENGGDETTSLRAVRQCLVLKIEPYMYVICLTTAVRH